MYVLDNEIPNEPHANNAPRVERDAYSKHLNDSVDVTCLMLTTINFECSDPCAMSDPNGEFEPKPGDAWFISFIFRVIKFSFSKISPPESPTLPEWRVRTGARFTPTFSFILSKHFINSFICGSGFSFGQAHNHLQIQSNLIGP